MRYIAFLRGIGPTNPNMRGERLKAVFEDLGFGNVHTVIASGNVVFDSRSRNQAALESQVEKALPLKLGFTSTTIIRSEGELKALIKKNPFKGVRDETPNYLLVTFFKDRRPELCSVIELTKGRTPAFMQKLERQHGKGITSRTWRTVGRILRKMEDTRLARK
nr:hypothetical protein Hi04_10k_c5981_00037 [uncultured bacterium]